jgi:hypothetical protein
VPASLRYVGVASQDVDPTLPELILDSPVNKDRPADLLGAGGWGPVEGGPSGLEGVAFAENVKATGRRAIVCSGQ